MALRSLPRRVPAWSILAWSVMAVLPALLPTSVAAGPAWPTEVQAEYSISFNGLGIGKFRYHATVAGDAYEIQGSSKMSALLGAFKYRGTTKSAGRLQGDDLQPNSHGFQYKSNSKRASLKIGFSQRKVTSVEMEPKREPSSRAVPLKPKHMDGVIDPLSAVMAITRGTRRDACKRTFELFDGKQRFNLVFSDLGEEKIEGGAPGKGTVCQVRYVPIAGHKPNDNTKALAEARIELVLRPLPSVGLMVPHEVRVPTAFGQIALRAERVDVTSRDNGRIALVSGQ